MRKPGTSKNSTVGGRRNEFADMVIEPDSRQAVYLRHFTGRLSDGLGLSREHGIDIARASAGMQSHDHDGPTCQNDLANDALRREAIADLGQMPAHLFGRHLWSRLSHRLTILRPVSGIDHHSRRYGTMRSESNQ
jgi:hypothetical protein